MQRSTIVVTHDNEFSDRRIKNGIHGKHVWLRCREFDAAEVLLRDLPKVTALLSSRRDVLVELHLNSAPKIHRGVKKAHR